MKLNKNQKNIFWLVLGSSILLGASLGIGLKNKIEFIDTNSSETMINKNAFVYDGPVLERDSVIALGWDQKETITLDDWKNHAPNVTTIGDSALNEGTTVDLSRAPFANNSILASIQIPPTIQNINYGSFAYATSLISVEFSGTSQLQSIRRSAFEGSGITSINIPNSVTIIDGFAFNKTNPLLGNQVSMLATLRQNSSSPLYGFTQNQWDTISWRPIQFTGAILTKNDVINMGWNKKTTITLDDWANWAPNVTYLGDPNVDSGEGNEAPFSLNSFLESIVLPAKITNIGFASFFSTPSLVNVTFENNSNLQTIGHVAFKQSAITSINIPNSVTSIGNLVFLETNSLPGNQVSMLSTLRQNSFSPLYGFTQEQWDTIEWRLIPFTGTILTKEDVINLGWDTKTEITLSDWQTLAPEVTKIGLVDEEIHNSPFASNTILQSIEIPAKITAINYGAFYSTSSLRTITFEENSELFTIGKSAFERASITELIIPKSVKIVDDLAFKNTSKLTGDKISMPITLSKNSQTPLYGFSQAQWDLINWFSPTKNSINSNIVIGSLSCVLILLLVMNALIILNLKKINNVENSYDKNGDEEDSSKIQDDSSKIQEDNVEIWTDKYH